MNLRVAITRASPGAEQTAEQVRARGHTPVLAPLLTIAPCAFDTNVDGVQALLFTSSAGARAFAAASRQRDVAVLAVGDAAALAARAAGFASVASADGDAEALARLAIATLRRDAGMLVHVSGADASGDLAGRLTAAGFHAERRVAYAAAAARTAPAGFAEALDLVLFHSPRGAETFCALGAPGAAGLTAACLSQAVAEAARAAAWRRVIVAPTPREDALLDAALPVRHAPTGASA